jgi:hypothetical protein
MKANRRADSAPAKATANVTSEKTRQARRALQEELWASLALWAIALVAYSNSLDAGFVLDDGVVLREKQIYEATSQNIGLIFGHTYWWPIIETGLYRPLTILSMLFNYAVLGNGNHAEGYHWINFVLHAGNIPLALLLLSGLSGSSGLLFSSPGFGRCIRSSRNRSPISWGAQTYWRECRCWAGS